MMPKADEEVVNWLRRNSFPVDPAVSDDFRDLQQLRQILSEARVVGLAESTHGTKEFYQLRHRLLRFCVTELGYKILALEASQSSAEAVNDYILHGAGDRATVITGLGLVWWDVEEFSATIDWLREYNQSVGSNAKVHFHGLDFWNTAAARQNILSHLRIVAPEAVTAAEALFEHIACAEAKGMMRAHEQITSALYAEARRLMRFLAENRQALARLTSVEQCERVERHMKTTLQFLSACLTDEHLDDSLVGVPRYATLNNYARSCYMANNLLDVTQRHGADAKVMIWAHVFHLAVGFVDPVHGRLPNLGYRLRAHFGVGYYVFCFELNDGQYLARVWQSDDTLGELTSGTLTPAPEGSLPWHLLRADKQALMLDCREAMQQKASVVDWLRTTRAMHAVAWAWRETAPPYIQRAISDAYDGVIFVANTSATTPTPNARKSVLDRSSY